MKKVVYPGSFDPITFGHIDVIKRAAQLFDEVVVAIAESKTKQPLFTLKERVALAEGALSEMKNVSVKGFNVLLVDFMQQETAHITIKGLRALSDFEHEFQIALTNKTLAPEIESLFVMPSEQYLYLSSSIVKEVASLNGDVSKFVPASVAEALTKKFT